MPGLWSLNSTNLDVSIIEPLTTTNTPLFFDTYYRPQVWGGRGLNTHLGRPLPEEGPYGEAWELSSHSLHVSRIMEGPLAGRDLNDLWANSRSSLAGNSTHEVFPLLIKWLECYERLSLQVHPNDEMARRVLNEPYGKSEAWVIVGAEPTARVYAGIKPGVTRDDIAASIRSGTLVDCLHSFVPKVGDVISLPAGSIHAASGGVLIAEVQQSSDATFRLYDWDRLGLDGRPRALQVERALDAVQWDQGPISPVVAKSMLAPALGVKAEKLIDSEPFRIERYTLDNSMPSPHLGELTVWIVLDGTAELRNRSTGYRRQIEKSGTTLIPAAASGLTWESADPQNPLALLCTRLGTAPD